MIFYGVESLSLEESLFEELEFESDYEELSVDCSFTLTANSTSEIGAPRSIPPVENA
jgi:hypothetical protein